MESKKEVKELEKLLKDNPFKPIESPLKKWLKQIRSKYYFIKSRH